MPSFGSHSVLTEAIVPLLPAFGLILPCPLVHQSESMLLCLLHTRQSLGNTLLRPLRPRLVSPPVLLLRRHVGGGYDAPVRVDEPECDETSVAGLGGVFGTKRRYSVLAESK